MKECDKRKSYKSSRLYVIYISSNKVRLALHFTSPNYISVHFTSLHPTTFQSTSLHFASPNYISIHFTTLHFLPFQLHPATLHYPLIWSNPI